MVRLIVGSETGRRQNSKYFSGQGRVTLKLGSKIKSIVDGEVEWASIHPSSTAAAWRPQHTDTQTCTSLSVVSTPLSQISSTAVPCWQIIRLITHYC